ncbi:MAG: phosphatase PAP2 family protein [Ilumatobacter sp.]|nr:phosphatase PAP2 family protein [Ilumatobacter sp.]
MTAAKDKWWKTTWCVHRHDLLLLVGALVAVVAGGALVGFALTDWTAPSALTRLDERLADWFVDIRTPSRTDLATLGAFPADTPVKITITAIVVGLMLWRWRRWHEALFIALTLIFEAMAFITITAIVGRPRPDVDRLLDSPVNSSFPSGHVAAATVYAAFAIVVFWRTRAVWARALAVAVAATIPVAVGLARMYQGMHFFSDVVAGVVLGAVSLVVCRLILGHPDRPIPDVGDPAREASTSDVAAIDFAHAGVVGERVSP